MLRSTAQIKCAIILCIVTLQIDRDMDVFYNIISEQLAKWRSDLFSQIWNAVNLILPWKRFQHEWLELQGAISWPTLLIMSFNKDIRTHTHTQNEPIYAM